LRQAAGGGGGREGGEPEADGPHPARDHLLDAVFCTGGLVWAADWREGEWQREQQQRPSPPPLTHEQEEQEQQHQLLALAIHPRGCNRNPTNAVLRGPCAVQIWAVPTGGARLSGQGETQEDEAAAAALPRLLPRPVAALAHLGRVTWDVKWCPGGARALQSEEAKEEEEHGLLGVLAVASGDGLVRVCAVPTPARLATAREATAADAPAFAALPPPRPVDPAEGEQAALLLPQAAAEAEAAPPPPPPPPPPPLIALQPLATLRPEGPTGGPGLPCAIAWHPAPPHDRLLVGCWDGGASVWRVPRLPRGGRRRPVAAAAAAEEDSEGALSPLFEAEPLVSVRASHLGVRCVQWAPFFGVGNVPSWARGGRGAAAPAAPSSSSLATTHHHFLTCCQAGSLKLWDCQDPHQPTYDRLLNRVAANACAWAPAPDALALAAMADGSVRCVAFGGSSLADMAAAGETGNHAVLRALTPDLGCLWALAFWPGGGGGSRARWGAGAAAGAGVLEEEAEREGDEAAAGDEEEAGRGGKSTSTGRARPGLAAYGGDAGVVGVMLAEVLHDSRARRPHAALAALVVDGAGEGWLLGPRELPGAADATGGGRGSAGGTGLHPGARLYGGNAGAAVGAPRAKASGGAEGLLFTHPAQAVHCLAFGGGWGRGGGSGGGGGGNGGNGRGPRAPPPGAENASPEAAWLAAGHGGGLVRLLRVSGGCMGLARGARGAGAAAAGGGKRRAGDDGQPRRPRGRPRKHPLPEAASGEKEEDEEEAATTTEEEEEEAAAKTTTTTEEAAAEEEEEARPPPRRGRQPQQRTAGDDAAPAAEPAAEEPPPQRRPRRDGR
jgi:hypothetical protein